MNDRQLIYIVCWPVRKGVAAVSLQVSDNYKLEFEILIVSEV